MGETIGMREMTARVWHGCAWCKDGIQAGEKYQRWMWKDGSDVAFLAMHSVCFATIEAIRARGVERYSDEFPCERDDHEKGSGCEDCDPSVRIVTVELTP